MSATNLATKHAPKIPPTIERKVYKSVFGLKPFPKKLSVQKYSMRKYYSYQVN